MFVSYHLAMMDIMVGLGTERIWLHYQSTWSSILL